MGKKFAQLQHIRNDRRITKETDREFLYQLQVALLLALEERGRLSPMQYRLAEEKLRQQHRQQSRNRQEEA